MTEEEIMIRAREAGLLEGGWSSAGHAPVRAGEYDNSNVIRAAARALRDLSKPLSEIQPVDPDWEEAQAIAAQHGWANEFEVWAKCALAAIKRGRELERGQ